MSLSLRALLAFVVSATASLSFAVNVTYSPAQISTPDVEQIRVEFSESMTRVDNPFTVSCDPGVEGSGQWADNNTVWMYNLQVGKDEWGESRGLPGGSSCSITQVQSLQSAAGAKVQVAPYTFTVAGPNVVSVYAVPGFNGKLRESNPVLMIVFDGDIKPETLYNSAGSFLWYSVKSGPSETIALAPVTQDREALFKTFDDYYSLVYSNATPSSKNWVLVTAKQNLIPGAEINVSITNVKSAYASGAISAENNQVLEVRPQFAADVTCSRSTDTGPCMPENGVDVRFNANVPWSVAKNVEFQYVDAKSGKMETAKPSSEGVAYSWLGWIGSQLGVDIDNATVTSLDFKVRIAPESTATVVFPAGIADVDDRALAVNQYALKFGSYGEVIQFAQGLSVMEKNVAANTGLPISVMNLNQTLTIRKSGTKKAWVPVSKMPTIIDLIAAYEANTYAETDYDLFALAGIDSSQEVVALTGEKNKKQFIAPTFASPLKSGVYVISTKSSLADADSVSQYGLVLLTDFNIQLKQGSQETLAWVTSYSTGLPAANVAIQVYGCDKSVVTTGTTNAQGIYKFSKANLPSCENSNGGVTAGQNYFVAASTADDMAFTSSTFTTRGSWAMYAPGVEFISADINDEQVLIKPVVGINLVKPGQTVPVQLVATIPTQKGFKPAVESSLPQYVTITNVADDNVSFTLPLEWKNGSAQFTWNVPQTITLGLYKMYVNKQENSYWPLAGGDIEVSEFKVPLMSARVSLPQGPLVKVDDLEVSGFIQYANGVGAKDQAVDVSFYFAEASIDTSEEYAGFEFAKGIYTGEEAQQQVQTQLPNSDQVATIEGLSTDKDGLVKVSVSEKSLEGGQSVAQLLQAADRPYQLIVRMRYLDQMGEYQTVSTSETVYNVNTYLGTKVVAGTRASAQLSVVNLKVDGKASTSLSDIKTEVLKVNANVISEEIFGGLVKNVFEYELENSTWTPSCAVQAGVVNCAVGSLAKGSYVFQVTSKTNGQATYSKFNVDAAGQITGESDYYYDNGSDDRNMKLAANKESYKGGDTAKLSFESPFANCAALVTLERSDVIDAYVDTAACQNQFVNIPVKSELAPNVFASVYLAAGRAQTTISTTDFDLGKPSYRLGFANLKIDWEQYKLNVEVKTNQAEYKPAEMAVAEVTVTPEQGLMLGGDVTLVVIEENILTLRPNETYDLLTSLMGMRDHNVQTINNYSLATSFAQAVEAAESAVVGDEAKAGQEGGSGSEFEQMNRKLFDALVTMQTVPLVNGKATVSFKLNDKLTKFKVFAIATDAASKYGTGDTAYVAAQELQTVANLPVVARTGDIFPVAVTLQNNGAQDGTFKSVVDYVIYGINGVVLAQGTMEKSQAIASNGSQVVRIGDLEIPAGATSATYNVSVYNQNGLLMDRLVDQTQEIKPAIPVTVQEQYMVQMSGTTYDQVVSKDAAAVAGLGSIETSVFSSIVDSASTSIQSSFSASPFADFTVENQILVALIKSSAQNTEALDKVLAEVVSQVDSQGMIKYYPGSAMGSFWMTAEVVQLVAAQPWALARVPANLKAKWRNSFEATLSGGLDPAYLGNSNNAAIGLAAKVKAANVVVMLTSSVNYGSQVVAVLDEVNAVKNLNDLFEETVVDAVVLTSVLKPESTVATSNVMKFVSESLLSSKDSSAIIKSKAQWGWWGYSDEIVMTAKMVRALTAISAKSSDNRLDNLVKGLVDANRTDQWYTTRTKAWVLDGLEAFAAKFEAQPVSGTTTLANTESSVSSMIAWGQGEANKENGFVTQWTDADAKVTVTHSGQGQPWVAITTKAAVPVKGSKTQGLKVSKTVKNITRQDGTYAAGDLIQVEIKIENPSSLSHVGVFDPIPAGANILSEGWGPYNYSQKTYEGYKLYFEFLAEGETTVSYQFQLNNPGTFQMPPTRAEALYEPGIYGALENSTIVVK